MSLQAEQKRLDLVAIGRSSIDLYGEQVGGRLEDMGTFAKYIGGSPTNTAVGTARLGLASGLLTRVGADHFGRFIEEELTRNGVDITGVIRDDKRLTALAVLGIRDQTSFPLLFYRENCADMALCADDVDPALIERAGAILINGTHLSRTGVFEASCKAIALAKQSGARVVFDIDYRPVLWGLTSLDAGENRFVSSADVTDRLMQVAPSCDLIVGTEEEFQILGGVTDTVSALRAVRASTDAILVCKRGPLGCVVFTDAIGASLDDGLSGQGFQVEVFNVLGAGDAFMSGFLRGWLRDLPLETCCAYANACGAIVVSRHGCAPAMPTWFELETFLAGQWPTRLSEASDLQHIHWATTRAERPAELMVLAMDHRSQFDELAAELGADNAAVDRFKSLCLTAVDRIANGDPRFGVLLDDRFGMRGLERAADYPYWIGRPIELPGSRPLTFEGAPDVGSTLRTWPLNHVVKCLLNYHPDDPEPLRREQEQQIIRLFSACRETRHEFLLEVIASKDGPVDSNTIARVLSRFYDLGVRPDWWKLQPADDPESWRAIEATIERRDPLCRGVILLGLAASHESLLKSFKTAAPFGVVRGFAVGRTIFAEPAQKWLSGAMSEEAAVDALARNFRVLVDGWRCAKRATGASRAAE